VSNQQLSNLGFPAATFQQALQGPNVFAQKSSLVVFLELGLMICIQ
jgi:hypothetical protein